MNQRTRQSEPDEALQKNAISLLRSLPGLYLVLRPDDDFRIVDASDSYLAATMRARDEVVGRPLFEVFPADVAGADANQNLSASLRRVRETGEPDRMAIQRFPIPRPASEGGGLEERYWSPYNAPVLADDGSLLYLLHRVADVTEQRSQELQLRQYLELATIAERVARIGGWSVDLQSGVVTWSDAVCDIHEVPHGFAPDVATAIEFYAEEFRPLITELFQACAERGDPYDEEMEVVTATGRRVPVRVIGEAVRDDQGHVVLVHGAFQDVAPLREAEAALSASQRRFQQLADSLRVIIWTAHPTGAVDYANRMFWEYTGIDPRSIDLESGDWITVVHPEDRARVVHEWQAAVSAGDQYGLRFRIQRSDGEHRTHLVSGTPVRDDSGQVLRWYGTALDVEDAVREGERAASLATELTQTLNAMHEAFYSVTPDWRFLFINDAAERLLQRPREALLGRVLWDEFPEARETIAWDGFHEAYATGRPSSFEMPYEPLGIEVEVSVYPGDDRLSVFIRDVTEPHRAERLLAESEERFRGVARATTDVVWDWDLVTDAVWWSEDVEEIFGLTATDLSMTRDMWRAHIHPDDAESVVDAIHDAISNGPDSWRHEYRFRRADGEYVPVLDRATLIRDEGGTATRMVGGMNDLSERYDALRRIQEQARLLDEANDAIVVHDLDYHVTFWNAGAARLYGWDGSDALGADVRTLLCALDQWPAYATAVEQVASTGQWRGPVEQVRQDGSRIVVEATWTLIHDEYGRPRAVLAINRDMTEELALQAQVERAQRLEVLGQLTGGIAHDFNNLLTVVMGSTDLLAESLPRDSPLLSLATTAQTAARRGAELTSRLLAFARRQPLQPHPRNVNDVIAGVRPLLEQALGERISVDLDLEANVWTVLVDQPQLEACIVNLAVNARDAMPAGGSISIETRNAVLDDSYASTHTEVASGGYVMIALSDSGTGMSPEVLAQAFDPFFTTKPPGSGSGLGLSMVYGFVKQSGGHAQIDSELGRGTTVKIYLPRTSAAATAELAKPDTVVDGNDEHILVVEDDDLVRASVTEQLLSLAYRVTAVASAEGALRALESGVVFDLLFTDVMMPDMDGRELARLVEERYSDLPIVLTSGYTENLGLGSGAAPEWCFLRKPYTRPELAATLRAVLSDQ